MALIENLEGENWEDFLRSSFKYTLEVLKKDRYRTVGSSVDDLRSWLTSGGVSRVREQLNSQMDLRRFNETRQKEVNNCFDDLCMDSKHEIIELISKGVIPGTNKEWLDSIGLSKLNLNDLINRIMKGERPFEEWMYSHGYSEKDIKEIYRVIDQWLLKRWFGSSKNTTSLN